MIMQMLNPHVHDRNILTTGSGYPKDSGRGRRFRPGPMAEMDREADIRVRLCTLPRYVRFQVQSLLLYD
jgi:hypothetical protein